MILSARPMQIGATEKITTHFTSINIPPPSPSHAIRRHSLSPAQDTHIYHMRGEAEVWASSMTKNIKSSMGKEIAAAVQMGVQQAMSQALQSNMGDQIAAAVQTGVHDAMVPVLNSLAKARLEREREHSDQLVWEGQERAGSSSSGTGEVNVAFPNDYSSPKRKSTLKNTDSDGDGHRRGSLSGVSVVTTSQRERTKHLLLVNIFVSVCCCPLGLIAIRQSLRCRNALKQGDIDEAVELSHGARLWCYFTVVAGIFFLLFTGCMAAIIYVAVV